MIRLKMLLVVALVLFCITNPQATEVKFYQGDNFDLSKAVKNIQSANEICQLKWHNNIAYGYTVGQEPTDKIVTYFDPAACQSDTTYPFQLMNFSFGLVPLTGNKWPVSFDVVAFNVDNSDINCQTPAEEIFRFRLECDSSTWAAPSIGTFEFPDFTCIDQPIFLGLEYVLTDTATESYPSILYDTSSAPDSCINWYFFDVDQIGWSEWYDFFSDNLAGYPFYWLEGYPQSVSCIVDTDGDSVIDDEDNCPEIANAGQSDNDLDGHGDVCDNCPDTYNDSQSDMDDDFIGDICDECPSDHLNDIDNDSYCEQSDNCPGIYNPSQSDADFDGRGDACENCCVGIRNNGDYDPSDIADIDDIVFLIEYMYGFPSGHFPPCPEEADADGSGLLDIDDIVLLVEYMFSFPAGPPPADCP